MSTAEQGASKAAAAAAGPEDRSEDLRARIMEAARDIVSEEGLDALSMRALGVRVGCSPAAIYLHFHDKDELLRSVMEEGVRRLEATVDEELAAGGEGRGPLEDLAAMGRAYARFALENTGYFHAMFQMPRVPHMAVCPAPPAVGPQAGAGAARLLERSPGSGGEEGAMVRAAVLGWGLMHGLTSLYLSGHLSDQVSSHEEFMELIESAIDALRAGWKA